MTTRSLKRDPFVAGLLAVAVGWLVPGAGHFFVGQRWRGIAYFLSITATFAIGAAITRGAAVSYEDHSLAFFAQIFAGLPHLAAIAYDRMRPPELTASVVAAIDMGLLFTMVAGLLNLLLILDAYDTAHAAVAAEEAHP